MAGGLESHTPGIHTLMGHELQQPLTRNGFGTASHRFGTRITATLGPDHEQNSEGNPEDFPGWRGEHARIRQTTKARP